MRNTTNLAIIMALISFTVKSQEIKKDQTPSLVSRGTFFTGLSSNLSAAIAIPQGDFIMPGQLKPRFGYFIRDRMSLGISYQGTGYSSSSAPRLRMYHLGEVEMDYYWLAKKNLFLYSKTGLRLTQQQTPSPWIHKQSFADLKLGAGFGWRFKNLPALGMNVEAAYYLDPTLRRPVQAFPEITFGISYFFKPKPRK